SRGAVVNTEDLMLYGEQLIWCLDVWENEPWIDLTLLEETCIATPHIAGHSIQSKYRAILQMYTALCQLGFMTETLKPADYPVASYALPHVDNPLDVILAIYNPLDTSKQMKQKIIAEGAHWFDD